MVSCGLWGVRSVSCLPASLSACGEGDDFQVVAIGEGGRVVLRLQKGGLVVLDDDGLFGEAEFGEEGEDGGRAGFGAFAVESDFHGGLPF